MFSLTSSSHDFDILFCVELETATCFPITVPLATVPGPKNLSRVMINWSWMQSFKLPNYELWSVILTMICSTCFDFPIQMFVWLTMAGGSQQPFSSNDPWGGSKKATHNFQTNTQSHTVLHMETLRLWDFVVSTSRWSKSFVFGLAFIASTQVMPPKRDRSHMKDPEASSTWASWK